MWSDFLFHLQDRWLFYILFVLFMALIMIGHEIGHYIMARLFGMPVSGFSIGRGRLIKSWSTGHGTEWELRLFPIQGHILIPDQVAYKAASMWKRILVTIAGPVANFSFPFVAFFLFFLSFGYPYVPSFVTGIEVGKSAERAGMQVGDKIVMIEGNEISNALFIKDYVRPNPGKSLDVRVLREGDLIDLVVVPEKREFRDKDGLPWSIGYIGIQTMQGYGRLKDVRSVNGELLDGEDIDRARSLILQADSREEIVLGLKLFDDKVHDIRLMMSEDNKRHLLNDNDRYYKGFRTGLYEGNLLRSMDFYEVLYEAYNQSWRLIRNFATAPFQMFPMDTEKLKPELAVGVRTSWFGDNLLRAVALASLVSVIMGLINLLPFPGLDGYHIITDVIESSFSYKYAIKAKVFAVMGSIILLYASVIFANLPDMSGYWSHHYEKLVEPEE